MSTNFESYEKEICTQEEVVRQEMQKLFELHKSRPSVPVQNYTFRTVEGPVTLSDLFVDKDELILIHNMGKKCSYCTLWADGINGFTDHLESRAGLVLINNDKPEDQINFAASRGWRFRVASAYETSFSADMGFADSTQDNFQAGVSIFKKNSDGTIEHATRAGFGPGDLFCSLWSFLDLLPKGVNGWQPKTHYPRQRQQFKFSPNIALNVRELDQAISFYRDTLGFSLVHKSQEADTAMVKDGMTFYLASESEKAGQVFFEFEVENLDSSVAMLTEKSCQQLQSTSGDCFKGQMMADPFGMKFHLYQSTK